jgi:hypothetical protein
MAQFTMKWCFYKKKKTKLNERPPLVGEVSANFAERGCRVVSATDSHGR